MADENTQQTAVQPGQEQQQAAPQTGTQEQQQQQQAPPAQNERPAWLPEKFKDAEQMASAYAELEKKLGQPKEPPAEAPKEGTKEPPKGDPEKAITTDPKQAEADLKAVGVDYAELSKEFLSEGALSDASYKKLTDAGIPREMVDNYIAGQQAIAERLTGQFMDSVGGAEQYTTMCQWAVANWSAEQRAAYDAAVDSGDINKMVIAGNGLRRAYEQANGAAPKLFQPTTGAPSGDAFRSTAEVIAAINDPRYKTDSAYRKDVEERIGRSSVL